MVVLSRRLLILCLSAALSRSRIALTERASRRSSQDKPSGLGHSGEARGWGAGEARVRPVAPFGVFGGVFESCGVFGVDVAFGVFGDAFGDGGRLVLSACSRIRAFSLPLHLLLLFVSYVPQDYVLHCSW